MSDVAAADHTLATDEATFKANLDEEMVELLRVWKSRQSELLKFDTPSHGFFRRRFENIGTDLVPEKYSFRDSLVILGGPDNWRAARIESIFDIVVHPRGEKRVYTLCKIKYFMELSGKDLPKDFYRHHSNTGRVFYLKFDSKDIVSVGQITTHFCMTTDVFPGISTPHMHALPLFQAS